ITFLGLLAEALLGQNRFEEAIKVGWPVVELSAQVGELPDLMGVSLVKKMADYFLEKKDYISAVRLWDAGVKCQPGDVNPLLELSKALLLAGDTTGARFRLAQAQVLAPKDETISALLQQVGAASELSAPIIRHPKRRH
ncbi:MAG: hypothetical protein NT121_11950, partial [Chloroflexi bacterium]|nr:hypothetical protein [Chloroflexota bacterium]